MNLINQPIYEKHKKVERDNWGVKVMEKNLPTGWVETQLSSILKLKNGYAFKSNDYKDVGIPVIRISEIQDGNIVLDKAVCVDEIRKANDFLIEKGDILIAMSGATTGKFGIYNSDEKAYQNQRVGNLRPNNNSTNKKFIYYLIGNLRKEIEEKAYGGAQPNISAKLIEEINFYLPPLQEQERIVAKLDSLFAHLETAKQGLEKIPVLLKQFRQAVLTQAVTGKLTEEWREGKGLGEWNEVNIEFLVNDIKKNIRTGPFGSTLKKSEHKLSGVPVWGIESIGQNGEFTSLNKIFVSFDKANDLKSFEVKSGDLIISRSGTVGEICILPEGVPYGLISTNLMKIVLDRKKILSKFFCWTFSGDLKIKKDMADLCKGSTRLFITQGILKKLIFNLPPITEQTEIVHRVEALFSKADVIEAQYKKLKEQIDQLPQAILAKAFRGEV